MRLVLIAACATAGAISAGIATETAHPAGMVGIAVICGIFSVLLMIAEAEGKILAAIEKK